MNNKNLLMGLAAFLVIALAVMAYITYGMKPATQATNDEQTNALMDQSTSDDAESIEQDLNDTELDSIDAGLNDIETQLNSSN